MSSPLVDVGDIINVFMNDAQYYVIFVDSNGIILAKTQVFFNVNAIIYNCTTNEDDTVKLIFKLWLWSVILTALNTVAGEMKSDSLKVRFYTSIKG